MRKEDERGFERRGQKDGLLKEERRVGKRGSRKGKVYEVGEKDEITREERRTR